MESVNTNEQQEQPEQITEGVVVPPQQHPDNITADYVMNLQDPTDRFLCKLADNWPKFKFGGFKIRDMISKLTLVDVPE